MDIAGTIQQFSSAQYWLFTGLAAAGTLAGLYFSLHFLRLARIIEDVPTARIRSAQQGYVELSGTTLPDATGPLASPLTGSRCCWFRYKIEKEHDKGWRTLEHKSSNAPFFLQDETSICVILPDGAEITPSRKRTWYGDTRYPGSRDKQPSSHNISTLQRVGDLLTTEIGNTSRYRYTEAIIGTGEMLYAIGSFKSLDDLDHNQTLSTLTREILHEWKQNQAALLERFDKDGNGRIDSGEWEVARQMARRSAAEELDTRKREQPIHSLGATHSRHQPYLLSTLPEFELVRHYRFLTLIATTAFFACGIATALLFAYR